MCLIIAIGSPFDDHLWNDSKLFNTVLGDILKNDKKIDDINYVLMGADEMNDIESVLNDKSRLRMNCEWIYDSGLEDGWYIQTIYQDVNLKSKCIEFIHLNKNANMKPQ